MSDIYEETKAEFRGMLRYEITQLGIGVLGIIGGIFPTWILWPLDPQNGNYAVRLVLVVSGLLVALASLVLTAKSVRVFIANRKEDANILASIRRAENEQGEKQDG